MQSFKSDRASRVDLGKRALRSTQCHAPTCLVPLLARLHAIAPRSLPNFPLPSPFVCRYYEQPCLSLPIARPHATSTRSPYSLTLPLCVQALSTPCLMLTLFPDSRPLCAGFKHALPHAHATSGSPARRCPTLISFPDSHSSNADFVSELPRAASARHSHTGVMSAHPTGAGRSEGRMSSGFAAVERIKARGGPSGGCEVLLVGCGCSLQLGCGCGG